MRACPVENVAQLVPIVHVFEVEVLDGCSCDDEAVELLVAHLLEVTIEGPHVFDRRVFAGVRLDLHEVNLELQRCVREESDEVRLRRDFEGHEVEYGDAEGSYVLRVRTFVAQHEDVLFPEELDCRQAVRESKWHSCLLFSPAKLRISEQNTKFIRVFSSGRNFDELFRLSINGAQEGYE